LYSKARKQRDFEYKIVYETDPKTHLVVATIPELNHTSSFGASFAEAEANVREAALGYLEALKQEKKTPPKPAFHNDGTYLKIFFPIAA
jgi:predicted RNase H-like HicB family nuclease